MFLTHTIHVWYIYQHEWLIISSTSILVHDKKIARQKSLKRRFEKNLLNPEIPANRGEKIEMYVVNH